MNHYKAKGKGNDSNFDINLLQHCLDKLSETEITSNLRFRTSLILASLQNADITIFLTSFLTKISREEFEHLYLMATINIEKTEDFLKSNIETKGVTDLFRQFLIPKNKEVLCIKRIYIISLSVSSDVQNGNGKSI